MPIKVREDLVRPAGFNVVGSTVYIYGSFNRERQVFFVFPCVDLVVRFIRELEVHRT